MMKKQLLILMTLCISSIGYSQTFTDNYITYNVTSATSPFTVEITNYDNTGGPSVIIPSTVIYNTITYTMTSIANQAFANKGLTGSISIPNSVTTIGNQAFISNQFTGLILGTSVASIGGNAFDGNPLLTCVNSKATTAPSIFTGNGDTFGANYRGNIDLLIPAGANNSYVAASWTGFNSFQSGFVVNSSFLVDNVRYQVTSVANSTVSVKSYNTAGGNVVNIPATVTGACTSEVFNVTGVSHSAFGNLTTLSSVTLPNSITSIGDYAFANSGISSINIPTGITSLGLQVFSNNNLSSIVIPNGITSIGNYVFQGNQLTDVTIPATITSIGHGAFRGNPLNSVTSLATTPASVTTENGANDTFVTGGDRSGIELLIPANTTDIYVTNPTAGADWSGFSPVTEFFVVGDPLVEDYISYEVTSTSINTVTVTGWDSAGGTVVNIPATIQFGSTTFNVTEIGVSAFFDKGLTSVSIPNSITTIGTSAFNTNNLTSLNIPDSVITISSQAFVTNDLTNITIGNNVMSIEFGAFADNDLTSITFPSSVTNIGSIAFAANPLASVTSLATAPPTITTGTNDTFNISGDRSGIHLHIPPSTMGAYVTNGGALWTGFSQVTEDALLSTSNFELTNNIKIITTTDAIKVMASNNVRLQNYTLYNITGAKVTAGKENEISTSTFSSGIYILKLDFDRGTVTKKVIVN